MKAVGAFLGIPLVIGLLVLMYIGVSTLIGDFSANNRENNINTTNAIVNAGIHYKAGDAQRSGDVYVSSYDNSVAFHNGSLTFTVKVDTSGDYYLASKLRNTDQLQYGGTDTADVSVNGQPVGKLYLGYDAVHCQDNTHSTCGGELIKIHLQAGSNTITLSNESTHVGNDSSLLLEIIVLGAGTTFDTNPSTPQAVPTVYTPPQPPAVHVDTSVNALTDRWNTHTWGGSRTNGIMQQYPIMVLNIANSQGKTFSGTEKEGNNIATVTGTTNGSAFSFTVNGYTSTDSGANMLHCTFKGTVSQGAVQSGNWQCPDGRSGNFTLSAYAA